MNNCQRREISKLLPLLYNILQNETRDVSSIGSTDLGALYLKGGHLDFSHVTEIYMKKNQYKIINN